MTGVLIALVTVPLLAALISATGRVRAAEVSTVLAGLGVAGLAVSLITTVSAGPVQIGFLRVDAVSVIFLLATGFLYAAAAVYSVGYVRSGHGGEHFGRYARRYYLGFNIFAWSMVCAPAMNGLALLWIAVEITTVVSALLVALDGTRSAAEAAWKYVLLASAGLGIGLLATIFMYYAGAEALGASYDLAFAPLLSAGKALPHTAVQLAYVLGVLGYGTKVGLFPVHTWLPDAHSQAPTPISALLSGSLLAVSFYAVLRYYQIAVAALGPEFPRAVLLVFGIASLALAALYLLDQQDLKRMLAYSSVEHMGIMAIGIGFGAPIAVAGVLLHVVVHAAAKGNAFFGAGVLVQKYGTKEIAGIRAAGAALPWTGPLLLTAVLALSAMPPFGLFRSEFQIVTGGISGARTTAAAVLVVLVTVAFLGLSLATTRMLFVAGDDIPARGEPSVWMVVPMLAGVLVLVVLGVHPPAAFADLIGRGVAEIGGGP
ncbi:putative NADH-ubiquinone/plastoquinone oxidoreductase [Nocardia nova SH22a]|uniref:Putative NADH-ubiquinone/plastoquinone oxidoreductase n=1 Tax=Nocardia nova SH22a TaxID=1415166 RepID=W5TKQ8_9NOCA|nr:proton-conducting transporter membrane subunit [Nocardia nova]AHH19754.1 putative NADH-ubiquinone/plastoquinone oxidoreductase [Nocardia nova SH22a]